jgi:hypothetical protein
MGQAICWYNYHRDAQAYESQSGSSSQTWLNLPRDFVVANNARIHWCRMLSSQWAGICHTKDKFIKPERKKDAIKYIYIWKCQLFRSQKIEKQTHCSEMKGWQMQEKSEMNKTLRILAGKEMTSKTCLRGRQL